MQADNIIENIDLQLLSGLEFQRLSNLLRYYNLEFWRNFDHVHGCLLSGTYNIDRPFGMSICPSIRQTHYAWGYPYFTAKRRHLDRVRFR